MHSVRLVRERLSEDRFSRRQQLSEERYEVISLHMK